MNYLEVARKEYTKQLERALYPPIYEGLSALYADAKEIANEKQVLKVFQGLLRKISKWSQDTIDTEAERIKLSCGCYDFIEELLKAVIKSNIIVLTNTSPSYSFKYLDEKTYLDVKFSDFIHKCYIECARQFFNNPFLFYDEYCVIDLKKNQRETNVIIRECIQEAIRSMLPIKHILREYLGNTYQEYREDDELTSSISQEDIRNLQGLIKADANTVPATTSMILKDSLLKTSMINPNYVNPPKEEGNNEGNEDEEDKIKSVETHSIDIPLIDINSLSPRDGVVDSYIKPVASTVASAVVNTAQKAQEAIQSPEVQQTAKNAIIDLGIAISEVGEGVQQVINSPQAQEAAKRLQEGTQQAVKQAQDVVVPIAQQAATNIADRATQAFTANKGGQTVGVTEAALNALNNLISSDTRAVGGSKNENKLGDLGISSHRSSTKNEPKSIIVNPATKTERNMIHSLSRPKSKNDNILENSVYGNVSDDSDTSISYKDDGNFVDVYVNSSMSGGGASVSNVFIKPEDQENIKKKEMAKKKYFSQYTKL